MRPDETRGDQSRTAGCFTQDLSCWWGCGGGNKWGWEGYQEDMNEAARQITKAMCEKRGTS